MKCYRKNGSDVIEAGHCAATAPPSMKCYRKNGSDQWFDAGKVSAEDPQ